MNTFARHPNQQLLCTMDKLIGITSDDEVNSNHEFDSDEEFFGGKVAPFDASDEEMSDEVEEEEDRRPAAKTKRIATFDAFSAESEDDDHDEAEGEGTLASEESEKKVTEEEKNINELYRKSKLQALKDKKPKGKTGVVYLSKIPPYMKPTKMRQVLSRFGDVDRLFLKKETTQKHQQRVKSGGNRKANYEEGWAEFVRKKDAKLAAATLNGNTLGGRKGSFYYDDVMNVKYLSGFKWADLTEQITKEKEVRESKLQMEVSQARKLNKTFISNVQKSKMIENMKRKKGDDDDDKFRRSFEQRKVTTTRADGNAAHKKNEAQPKELVSKIL